MDGRQHKDNRMDTLPVYCNHADCREIDWKCHDGRILLLCEMETLHIYNVMKMCFNHLADAHGGTPIQFTRVWGDYKFYALMTPNVLIKRLLRFVSEIEERGNLPEHLQTDFNDIRAQINTLLETISAKQRGIFSA